MIYVCYMYYFVIQLKIFRVFKIVLYVGQINISDSDSKVVFCKTRFHTNGLIHQCLYNRSIYFRKNYNNKTVLYSYVYLVVCFI